MRVAIQILALAGVISLLGCGKSGEEGGAGPAATATPSTPAAAEPATELATPAAAEPSRTAASRPAAQNTSKPASKRAQPKSQHRLVGLWKGTVELTGSGTEIGLSKEEVETIKATKMDIHFKPDGTVKLEGVSAGKPYESGGTWEVISEQGDKLVFRTIESEDTESDAEIQFENAHTFSMPLPEDLGRLGAMKFRRLR